jgi:hypothetical protein
MGTTTNYALPYPEASDAPEVWNDVEALADATDTALDGIADALANLKTWTTFTPTFFNNQASGTPAAISKTTTRAGYWRIGTGAGSIIIAQAEIVATAAATGGASLGLPVTAAERWLIAGVAAINGASPPTQSGHAYMGSALDRIHVVSNTNAFQDCPNGYGFRYLVIYKSAS